MPSMKLTAAFLAIPVLVSGLVGGCGQNAADSAATSRAVSGSASASGGSSYGDVATALAGLEKSHDRRLGLYMLDTGTGRTVAYHADERFGFCSTSKFLQTGVLLKRSSGAELDKVITYGTSDLQNYSPITSQHVDTGMRLRDIMVAALQYSDNTAANLMARQIGGPAALERAMRALGDRTSDIDRTEPDLNDTPPGTTQDTSTVRALGSDLRRFLLGGVLRPDRRELMRTWMRGNTTGDKLIRAGVPSGWTVADKTGSGSTYGTQNDIAVAWRPHAAPVVIALMSRGYDSSDESDQSLLAEATKVALPGLR